MLLAGFLAARMAIWAGGKTFTSYDTFSYAYRDDPVYDRGPLVSFTGHAPRLWGAPLLYATLDSDPARAFTQWTIGTLAWATLATVLWHRLATTPARVLAGAGVLGLGVTPQVASWDLAILSESLSISLGILTLALLLWWSDPEIRHRGAALAALTACALWWTFTRPEIRLMTAVVVLGVAWIGWREYRRDRSRPAWRGAAAAVTVLAGAIVWVAVITPGADRTFAGWSATGLPLSEETLNYRLRLQVLPDPEIKAAYREHLAMPGCPAADRIAAGPSWAIVQFAGAYRGCPELAVWGRRNAGSSGYRFALTAPGPYLRYTWDALPASLGGAVLTRTGSALPAPVQRAAFPPQRLVLPAILGALAAACAAALITGAWTRCRALVATAAVLAVASLVSVIAQLMYAVGVFGRYGIQEAIGLRLSVLVLLAAALDAGLGHRARVPPGEAGPHSARSKRGRSSAGTRSTYSRWRWM